LELKTKPPKSDPNDEDNDLEFYDLDYEMNLTSLEVPTQGALIDLDSMLKVQAKRSQQPLKV
jgi:hypothetical protein